MIGLVFDGRSPRVVDDLERPAPKRGEARLGLLCAGVCNTDLEIARGYMGFTGVLGHEFVARVIDCEDPAWIGARVVGGINCGCGACRLCLAGLANHCASRSVLGILGRPGAFAEEFTLPLANLRRVPSAVSDESAVFAEPLAAAWRIVEQVAIGRDDAVAILGAGKLGTLIAHVLALRAGAVTVFSRHPGRGTLPPGAIEVPAADAESSAHARRYTRVVDATGSEAGLETALRLVAPTGTVVLKTTCFSPHRLSLAPVVIDEVSVVGSRCGPFEPALEQLAQGTIPIASLVTARFPLEQADLALEAAARRGARKVLILGKHQP